MSYVLKFEHSFTCIVSEPSGSYKTSFCYRTSTPSAPNDNLAGYNLVLQREDRCSGASAAVLITYDEGVPENFCGGGSGTSVPRDPRRSVVRRLFQASA